MVRETLVLEEASKVVKPRNARNRRAESSQQQAMLKVSEGCCTRPVDRLRVTAKSILDASGLGSSDLDRIDVCGAIDLRQSDFPQLLVEGVVVSDQGILARETAVVFDREHVFAQVF
jgi:hypothetical protein